MGLPQQAWLSVKEKVPVTAVIKEGHVDSVLGYERTQTVEKGATLNSASYCQLLGQNSLYL